MTIDLAREQLREVPDDENIAFSHFHFGGTVTAKQVRDAISGRPGNDHVKLWGDVENPSINVCTTRELGIFFCLG
jgi:hypothetical protein